MFKVTLRYNDKSKTPSLQQIDMGTVPHCGVVAIHSESKFFHISEFAVNVGDGIFSVPCVGVSAFVGDNFSISLGNDHSLEFVRVE